MKTSWKSVLIVSLVLGLLAGLAALQYYWQRQASDAAREKMQKRVEADAGHFAEDFNKEIQAAFFNFQTQQAGWSEGQPAEFNERYEYWLSKTSYPELIRDFYFFEDRPDSPTLRYDRQGKRFVAAEPPPEVRSLRGRAIVDKDARPVYPDIPALVVPVHAASHALDRIIERRTAGEPPLVRAPERFGNLVVLLDQQVIAGRVLPDLVQKYFGDGDYKVSVVNKEGRAVFGETNGTDASASLFEISPDKFVIFAGRDMLPKTSASETAARMEQQAEKHNIIVSQQVETLTKAGPDSLSDGDRLNVQFERSRESPRTQIFTRTGSPGDVWKLNVQHAAGSVAAFIDGAFRRNLAIGAGLYALLAAAILGIFFSAQKAKAFAQRQMDFVSSVSHEFRTPLAVIYSAGENLADGVAADRPQVQRYGELIKGEGRKLSAMVEQILQFAGAGSGRQKYSFAATDVAEVIGEALGECRPLIDAGGVEVETVIPDKLPNVSADRAALSRAIQNLIANSVKYGNGSRWVKVSAANDGDAVTVAVEDKGIGIHSSAMKHIFEPFYRAKEVVDAQIHGNGLGLSLVKQIAEAHGGKISARSTLGKGSKFTIELPVKSER